MQREETEETIFKPVRLMLCFALVLLFLKEEMLRLKNEELTNEINAIPNKIKNRRRSFFTFIPLSFENVIYNSRAKGKMNPVGNLYLFIYYALLLVRLYDY
jgi:hypothetical protein